MDIFLEQLVVKNYTKSDKLLKIGLIAAVVVIVAFSFFVLPLFGQFSSTIGIIAAFVAIGMAFYLISNMRLEYEYIFTNGELDIDCIKAKSSRKRMLSVKVEKFEQFGAYRYEAHNNDKYNNRVMACGPDETGETYFAVFHHGKLGRCLLLFNPNEPIKKQIQYYMDRK